MEDLRGDEKRRRGGSVLEPDRTVKKEFRDVNLSLDDLVDGLEEVKVYLVGDDGIVLVRGVLVHKVPDPARRCDKLACSFFRTHASNERVS